MECWKKIFLWSLYGLKQSPRMWNKTIDDFMQLIEFTKCESDHCVCIKSTGQEIIFVALYVDDLIIASSNVRMLQNTKQGLRNRFEITDIGQSRKEKKISSHHKIARLVY
ncbi:putative reverse transcriptase, RNA-dependent DNA polymerase [Plasmopara halstedii]